MTTTRTNPSPEEIADLLERGPLARLFSWDQLIELAKWVSVRHYAARTRIFEEGEREAYMAVVAAGRIDVLKKGDRGESCIATIGAGQTLGEMSIIDGEPRSAAAVADTETTLLPRRARISPALARAAVRHARHRLRAPPAPPRHPPSAPSRSSRLPLGCTRTRSCSPPRPR